MPDKINPMSHEQRIAVRATQDNKPLFTVRWERALFEHFRIVDEGWFAQRLPKGLVLDKHDGSAYMSIVSFHMADMRWRNLLRIPAAHTYPQINVRVYVRSQDKAGVLFLRNYVSNPTASWAGRVMYGMPYRYQPIVFSESPDRSWSYKASLTSDLQHEIEGAVGTQLTGHENDPEQLLFFLVERYPLFSQRGWLLSSTYVAQMYHPPWALYECKVLRRTTGILNHLGLTDVVTPLNEVQISPGVDVQMWGPQRLKL